MPKPTEDTAPTADEPIDVRDDLVEMKARAEAAEAKRDEFLALVKQTQADFENYQKRAAREREAERPYQQRALAADLLPAVDNLERAVAAARQAGDNGPLAQGVAATLTQLLDALKRHGVVRIVAEGQPFDPNRHEAVMQQPSAEHEPGTVLQVLEHGYTIHERVLRPARVIVSVAAG
jgi:molecular chaperone GrpE